jgi:hypothetical protein
MAQELLRYQPTDDAREGWRARIAKLIAIANEDPAQGGAQGAGVVVVKQHMQWDGLNWGRTYTGGSGGGKAW